MLPMFTTKGLFNVMRGRHQALMEKYPNIPEARGFPFAGVSNVRPETVAQTKPRFTKEQVPYDVQTILESQPEWAGFERDWSAR